MDYLGKGKVLSLLTNTDLQTDLWTKFERNRPFVYIEKVLDLWVQLIKNGGKNKSVVFIILFSASTYTMCHSEQVHNGKANSSPINVNTCWKKWLLRSVIYLFFYLLANFVNCYIKKTGNHLIKNRRSHATRLYIFQKTCRHTQKHM